MRDVVAGARDLEEWIITSRLLTSPEVRSGQYLARLVTPPALSTSTTTVVVGVSTRRSPNWNC